MQTPHQRNFSSPLCLWKVYRVVIQSDINFNTSKKSNVNYLVIQQIYIFFKI